jgi:arginine deiminase
VRTPVGEWLSQLDAPHLAGVLIGGATFEEAGIEPPRIAGSGSPGAASRFAVAPLPNQMFVRDTSAWLGTELVLGARSNPVRSGETRAVEQVYEHHPMFGRIPRRRGPIDADGIEGGDLMCLGDRAILVGIGSRTSREGVEGLAAQLFERGFERVLTVEIPPERSSIHLDCLMTLVDADAMLVDRRLLDSPVVEMLPAAGPVSSRIWPSLPAALAAALEIDAMRVVEVADEREQWTLGANTLAVAPGRVIAFSRNVRTNDALAAAGIEVLPVPGEELSRGRGGPRCLTCPLTRAPVVAS